MVVVERGLHQCDAHFASSDLLERTNVIVIIVFVICMMVIGIIHGDASCILPVSRDSGYET